MVDYAIAIFPKLSLEDKIINKLRSDGASSINQTNAEHIRFKPIVINIETKRQGGNEETARYQIGVWAAALFDRLQQLSSLTGDQLPMLPQILVHGHD